MRSVLAIGAHPGDIEYGCAGALAAHLAAGDQVTLLVLTDAPEASGGTPQRRAAAAAARHLGVLLVRDVLTDATVTDEAAVAAAIENVITGVNADVVYVHAPDDTHPDHRAGAAAALSASRHNRRVLYYAGPSTVGFDPTIFVDISAHLVTKLAVLAGYRGDSAPTPEADPAALARRYGAQARVRFAEAFAPARFVWDLAPAPLRLPPVPVLPAPAARVPAR